MTDAPHPIHRWVDAVCACVLLAGLSALRVTVAAEASLTLNPTQVEALGVRTLAAAPGATTGGARYPASVLIPSGQQRVVAAPLPALVESLLVSVGDTVRAGQILGALRSAQAQELQHDVHVARSQATLSGATLTRDEQLYQEGLIATSRLEASRAQASLAREQRDERELALRQAGGSARQEGGGLALKAPISGVVMERPVVVGQRVEANSMLYRLAILSPLWLEMQIPARDAGAVRLGDTVSVSRSTARGRVIAIGPAVDAASQSILVRAELAASVTDLRPGQGIEAQLEGAAAGLVSVASGALIEERGGTGVFVEVTPGRFELRPVTVVGSAEGTTSVRGLAAGSRVVVQGMASLKAMRAARAP